LVSKLLSNDEPNADNRLAIVNENGVISKIEKISKEDLEEEVKNTINGIFKVVHEIENKQTENPK